MNNCLPKWELVTTASIKIKKQRLGLKLAGVAAKGASKQNLGPRAYFCNR